MQAPTGSHRRYRRNGGASQCIHWPRTLLNKNGQPLQRRHLAFHPQTASGNLLHCLLLDCSASMLSRQNLALAKGLLLDWARQIYRRRADLAVIGFSGQQAQVLQAPRKAVAFNENWIAAIQGGGGTPAQLGVEKVEQLERQVRRKSRHHRIGVWLLTDGRFSVLPRRPAHVDFCVVVDFEDAAVRLGRARQVAQNWQADYVRADELLR